MISGKQGIGKSTMGILLANKLKGSLCKTYSPIEPGNKLESLYNKVDPTFNNPLIILLDEFDILIDAFHNNNIILHKNIPIEVHNKITWNSLFDDIKLKLYPNIIVLLTSNLSKEDIEKKYKDKSYIREGRINMYHSLN
jgi:deoxyadenosine/deoxycytidine kinase